MSKAQKDHEIEAALLEMFDFPSDPNQSEDDNESDEEETSYNATKLKRILEEIDDPGSEGNRPWDRKEKWAWYRMGKRTRSGKGGSTRGTRQKRRVRKGGKSPDREDSDSTDENDLAEAQVDLEENASDEDEDMWKKSSWTADRPEPDIFDSIPLSPTRMLPSNARPIRHFEKNFTQDVF
ncbi:hypothetical protein EVAR_14537_1 [Eumeta japonica]|uniref:Uncharacterized protein n=1 Tax=Eumeta variegata TaxID=151549 RepID=A0A4C1U3D4_EUMVA|nr:hypothetical protein EVAR_14537_1 [Eumeta japonica]